MQFSIYKSLKTWHSVHILHILAYVLKRKKNEHSACFACLWFAYNPYKCMTYSCMFYCFMSAPEPLGLLLELLCYFICFMKPHLLAQAPFAVWAEPAWSPCGGWVNKLLLLQETALQYTEYRCPFANKGYMQVVEISFVFHLVIIFATYCIWYIWLMFNIIMDIYIYNCIFIHINVNTHVL